MQSSSKAPPSSNATASTESSKASQPGEGIAKAKAKAAQPSGPHPVVKPAGVAPPKAVGAYVAGTGKAAAPPTAQTSPPSEAKASAPSPAPKPPPAPKSAQVPSPAPKLQNFQSQINQAIKGNLGSKMKIVLQEMKKDNILFDAAAMHSMLATCQQHN